MGSYAFAGQHQQPAMAIVIDEHNDTTRGDRDRGDETLTKLALHNILYDRVRLDPE
jgi:hypothetical protein